MRVRMEKSVDEYLRQHSFQAIANNLIEVQPSFLYVLHIAYFNSIYELKHEDICCCVIVVNTRYLYSFAALEIGIESFCIIGLLLEIQLPPCPFCKLIDNAYWPVLPHLRHMLLQQSCKIEHDGYVALHDILHFRPLDFYCNPCTVL